MTEKHWKTSLPSSQLKNICWAEIWGKTFVITCEQLEQSTTHLDLPPDTEYRTGIQKKSETRAELLAKH